MSDLSLIVVFFVVTGVVAAVPLIVMFRGWKMWNTVRRKRLHWAIVHANLLTTLVIVGLFALREGVIMVSTLPAQLSNTMPLLSIVSVLVPPLLSLILSIPVVIGLMALTAVIAYRVTQPLVTQIGRLAGLMAQLQAGNYAVRSIVEGQDELQQLQIGFNLMAAELAKTLEALRQERETMNRLLASRRELFAEVSHELRTPTATLRGYLDSALINWRAEPPATLHQDLEIASHELERLQHLIDDLFLLARAEAGQLSLHIVPIDVGKVAQQVVKTVAPLAWSRGRVRVVVDAPEDLPHALSDTIHLEQILQNLLQNGIRHTPPGGIVAVTVRSEPDSKTIFVDICDTGEGIRPAELTHIWERFYRGSGQSGSAGIGLALVNELTVAMGGSVSVESIPEQGTCFKIMLVAF